MQNKYGRKNLALIAVSHEDEAVVKTFLNKQRPKVNYIVAAGGRSSKAYGVDGIPHIFVIDGHGKVAWVGRDGREAEKIVQRELKLLGDAKPGPLVERRASADLAAADALLESGKKDAALRKFKSLVSQYHGTQAAAKAKDRIAKIEKPEG